MHKYFLSEMTISPKHGGGLTLLRVLGDDILSFEKIISPKPYPLEGFETIESLQSREINLWRQPGDFKGATPKRYTFDHFLNYSKTKLEISNPKFNRWDYYKREYTRYLRKNIDLKDSKFLVVPQNAHSIVVANQLHKLYQIEYVTWVMDDNLLQFNEKSQTYHYPFPGGFESEFKYHLRNAAHVFTISENMGDFYRSSFGIDYSVLFSPTDPVKIKKNLEPAENDVLRFGHFGRVWNWSVDAVEQFSKYLEQINATLDIYSHIPVSDSLRSNARINIQPPVSGDHVLSEMAKYDAVTIFYGFENKVRHFSEMNISTKMSECLASGVPTVFIGPENGAMTRWARAHDCGILLTDFTDLQQLNSLNKLRDPDFRSMIIEKSLRVVDEFASVRVMRNIWSAGWNK